MENYAEANATLLPGKIPGYKRDDLKLLPCDLTEKVSNYISYNTMEILQYNVEHKVQCYMTLITSKLQIVNKLEFLSIWYNRQEYQKPSILSHNRKLLHVLCYLLKYTISNFINSENSTERMGTLLNQIINQHSYLTTNFVHTLTLLGDMESLQGVM